MNAGNYDYGNARLKALKSQFFRRKDYERFIELPALSSLFAALAETCYKSDVHQAMVRYPETFIVPGAARFHLVRLLHSLRSFYQERALENVNAYFVHWDVLNLKTIFRGVSRKVPPEEIQSYLTATSELDEAACIELTRQPDLKSVMNLLRLWSVPYTKELMRSWPVYIETGSTSVLELALERFRYDLIFKSRKRNFNVLRDSVAAEIDAANLTAMFVLLGQGRKPFSKELTDCFVYGDELGISSKKLQQIQASKSVEELIKHLSGTPYGAALQKVLPQYVSGGRPDVFQRELENLLLKQGQRMLFSDALGLGVVVGFERALAAESANLRLIAQGKIAGLNREEIWNDLLIPFEENQ